MDKWVVVLCVGETKFYAHKHILSFVSETFRTMFKGEFREKNQQEVPVNVDGIDAEHFEAFLQCLYPSGREPKGEFLVSTATLADYFNAKPVLEKCLALLAVEPTVSDLDKFRVALKVRSTALEDKVMSKLNKEDIRELLASDMRNELNDARWVKLTARLLSL